MYTFHSALKSVFTYFDRYRLIHDRLDGEPYLERYYLFLKDRIDFPFNIFLHKFLKSDPDDLHDHPWNYSSLILKGGYWEHTEHGKFWRAPLTFRSAPAETFHRIELDKNVPDCWTLFFPGKKVKDWGFKTKDGWVQHESYYERENPSKNK